MGRALINLGGTSEEKVDLGSQGEGFHPNGKHPAQVSIVIIVPGALGQKGQEHRHDRHATHHAPPFHALTDVVRRPNGRELHDLEEHEKDAAQLQDLIHVHIARVVLWHIALTPESGGDASHVGNHESPNRLLTQPFIGAAPGVKGQHCECQRLQSRRQCEDVVISTTLRRLKGAVNKEAAGKEDHVEHEGPGLLGREAHDAGHLPVVPVTREANLHRVLGPLLRTAALLK
mmetsp:Transcript_40924/g.66127  ORF Transcript_40924/g.66127 Transcript_40924/m.66127 type:complete len:231 (+) Transcript_40924:378-1070(+)